MVISIHDLVIICSNLMSLGTTNMENNTYAMPHSIVSSGIYNPYGGMQ